MTEQWTLSFSYSLPGIQLMFIYLFILNYLFIYLFNFFLISWRLITLQYCSGFCHTLKWISHGFTCIPHPNPSSHLPLHPVPLGLPSAPGPSACLKSSYSIMKEQGFGNQTGFGEVRKLLNLATSKFLLYCSKITLSPHCSALHTHSLPMFGSCCFTNVNVHMNPLGDFIKMQVLIH